VRGSSYRGFELPGVNCSSFFFFVPVVITLSILLWFWFYASQLKVDVKTKQLKPHNPENNQIHGPRRLAMPKKNDPH